MVKTYTLQDYSNVLEKNEKLSIKSKKAYVDRMRGMMKSFGYNDISPLVKNVMNTYETIIEKYPNIRTAYNNLIVIQNATKLLKLRQSKKNDLKTFRQEIGTMKEKVNGLNVTGEISNERNENVMKRKELKELLNNIEDGNIEKVLLSLYMNEPLRADYNNVLIVEDGSTPDEKIQPNYLKLEEDRGLIVIREFKTSKRYKVLTKELVGEDFKIFKDSYEKRPREYLFQQKTGEPYTEKAFSNWANRQLKKLTGKNITLSLLRRIFVTEEFKNMDLDTRVEVSRRMGHNIKTQHAYKINNNNNNIFINEENELDKRLFQRKDKRSKSY